MDLDELVIDPAMLRVHGRDTVAGIAAALHPQGADCQTCTRPLTGNRMSLCVDQTPNLTVASLHHAACRRSVWNNSPLLVYRSDRSVTYSWSRFLAKFDAATTLPLAFLTPCQEEVPLARDADGRWRPDIAAVLPGYGLTPHPADHRPGRTTGIHATISAANMLHVTFPTGLTFPHEGDGHPEPDALINAAQLMRGVVLAITYATLAAQLNSLPDITNALFSPLTVTGWVPLAGEAA